MGTIRFTSIGPMTTDEKIFFQALGLRIAGLRNRLFKTESSMT